MGDHAMTVSFPSIQPTEDEFVAASWPVTASRSQSGVRSVRAWSSEPSDAGMVLVFANITQTAAGLILKAYDDAKGAIDDLLFPPVVWNNLTDPNLLVYLARSSNTGLKWYWVSAPSGNRVPGGKRITMRCEFRAELRL